MLVEKIELDWPIRKARPGTKSKTLELLAKLGIVSVLDLLAHLPRSYENRTHITSIADACEGERQTFEGYIYRMSNSHQRVNGKLRPAQIGLLYQDEREVVSQRDYLQIVWFGQKHLVSTLRRYYRLRVHGTVRVDPQTGRPQLFQPEYDVIAEPWGPTEPAVNSGRIVPIYPLTTGLRQDFLRVMIWQFLEKYHTQLERSHPGETGHSLGQILWTVNFPREEHHPALARAELAVDEILEAQMALSHLRAERKKARFAVAIPVNRRAPGNSSPLSLSPSQTRAVEEIRNDFTRSGTPMNRVLQGDLDSDIMTVALCVMLDAARANQQSVLIAPTELLAEHYMRVVADLIGADSGSLAPGLIEATLPHHMRSFIVALLTSPVRDDLLKDITSGSVDLVIGTPAAVDKIAAFDQLGLVVNADQRPLGFVPEPRVTRDAHCLTLTTVPMPPAIRSTLYRDLDFSAIEPDAQHLPPRTVLVLDDDHSEVWTEVEKVLRDGRQAIVVCPCVEPDDNLPTASVAEMRRTLAERFERATVGVLHEEMRQRDQDAEMRKFQDGRTSLLVSTSMIERTVHVANATVMVITSAERFGMARLHQMRSRIGHGDHEGACYLVTMPGRSPSPKAVERLTAVANSNNGLELAEGDLRLRTRSVLAGGQQWERASILKTGDSYTLKTLENAHAVAEAVIARGDSDLKLLKHHHLLLGRERMLARLRREDSA